MSCNSVYVDDEFDKSTDNCNTKKRRELVRRGFERNCGSVDTERTRKSDKGIMNSAGDTIPLKSYSSGRRIQTVIWQAVLRLGRQNLDDYFRVKETTDEEPFAQQCSFNSSCVSDMDLSQRASPVIHGREYSASHLLGLPPDIQIHIMSYLHPRDVLAMSCSDHNTQNLVNGDKNTSQHCSSTSTILWFTLWNRDYGWVLREWNIGMEAVQRSSDSIACSSNDNTLRCPSILASILNINTHHLDKPGEKKQRCTELPQHHRTIHERILFNLLPDMAKLLHRRTLYRHILPHRNTRTRLRHDQVLTETPRISRLTHHARWGKRRHLNIRIGRPFLGRKEGCVEKLRPRRRS